MAEDTWEFPVLLYRFLEEENLFKGKWEYKFEAYPWEIRAELKGFQAVLNAFTNGNYRVQSERGRHKIRHAFMHGFGKAKEKCTDEQLTRLKDLFPYWDNSFRDWQKDKPMVGALYEVAYAMLYHGFKFFTILNDYPKESVAYAIVETFHRKEICHVVDDLCDNFIKAILILLGPEFERKIERSELIQNWDYPKVLN